MGPEDGRALLAVLASRTRFEERRIFEALERRGVPFQHLDPRALWFDLHGAPPPYCGAISRELAHTRALYAARLLQAKGIPSVNSAAVIQTCGDKLLTSLALVAAGLPTPRTAVALSTAGAAEAIEALGYPVVLKPLVGSWGRLAARVRDQEAALALLEHRQALPNPQQHVVYAQEHVDKPDRDIRVIVVGDQPLCAMYRVSRDWRCNVARGAKPVACPLVGDVAELALLAAKAVGGGVVGVDLLEDRGGGLRVLEVNHTVEFRALQSVTELDIADALVAYALRELGAFQYMAGSAAR